VNTFTKAWDIKAYTLDGSAYCKACAEDGDAGIFGQPVFESDEAHGMTCDSCRHYIDEPERIEVNDQRARATAEVGGDYYIEVARAESKWVVTEYHRITGYPWYQATYRTLGRAIADANTRLAEEQDASGIAHPQFTSKKGN
jgi:hypothetical protein